MHMPASYGHARAASTVRRNMLTPSMHNLLVQGLPCMTRLLVYGEGCVLWRAQFFGCYFNLFRLMAKCGVLENLLVKEHVHTFVNTGGDVRELDFRFYLGDRKIGAPFHGLKAFFTTPQLSVADKVRPAGVFSRWPLFVLPVYGMCSRPLGPRCWRSERLLCHDCGCGCGWSMLFSWVGRPASSIA